MRLWHILAILGLGLLTTMVLAYYKGYRKLEFLTSICISIISFLGGVFFFAIGVIYIISDIRPSPIATSSYSGPGLGVMSGSGILLFVGIPLIITSILLFNYQRKKAKNKGTI